MGEQKLLIADSSEEFTRALSRELEGKYQIRCSSSGPQTLEALEEFRPDGLVLDLLLPGMDGIHLLRAARERGCFPAVLAMTTLYNPYIQQSLQELAVVYAMMKPCSVRIAAARVEDMLRLPGEHTSPAEPYSRITGALVSMGFRPERGGFALLLPAILFLARHPRASVTKELYPAVGVACGISPRQVERDIRLAIEDAWRVGNPAAWERVFPGERERPSNSRFLGRMAQVLRLD